ncbi:kinase binding protein CGI-121-domain-containing protein [Gorgonomyces haynaldii]|nr:kinase binding protein CGI-121-domain-containing protein [Gorgonomyces haynaldii]
MKIPQLATLRSNSQEDVATFEQDSEVIGWEFRDIQEPSRLLQELKTDTLPTGCYLDKEKIESMFHLQLAITKALMNVRNQKQKTHSIYSEMLYCLGTDTKVSHAFKMFGISSQSKHCVVLMLEKEFKPEILEMLQKRLGTAQDIELEDRSSDFFGIALQGH